MTPSPNILIIEFNHDIRVAYREVLESNGYVIVSTTNGQSGIEILQRDFETIRLVIISLRMPILDGNDFLQLKLSDSRLAAIPVIVIAQSPDDLRHPVAETLKKPISNSTLLEVVRKHLPPT